MTGHDGLSDPNQRQRLSAALALAEAGDFSGIGVIADGLESDNDEVRIKAARLCERIGPPTLIDALARMAATDPVSDNRNQAIYALVGIGRTAVVPALIAALDDRDGARRDDARTSLYRVIGKGVVPLVGDEGEERDPAESERVRAYWQSIAGKFDSNLVYSMGEPVTPGLFIARLKSGKPRLPDATLAALKDWTGEDFGNKPLSKVIATWEKWWSANRERYLAGRRYFYGHPVT